MTTPMMSSSTSPSRPPQYHRTSPHYIADDTTDVHSNSTRSHFHSTHSNQEEYHHYDTDMNSNQDFDSQMSLSDQKPIRMTGRVKFFNSHKGYGFIIPDEADYEVFVHHTAIKNEGGFRSLAEGEIVEFDVLVGPKGMQAANVSGPEGEAVQGDPKAGKGGPGKSKPHTRSTSQNQHLAVPPGWPPGYLYYPTGMIPSNSSSNGSQVVPTSPVFVPAHPNAAYYAPGAPGWGYPPWAYGMVPYAVPPPAAEDTSPKGSTPSSPPTTYATTMHSGFMPGYSMPPSIPSQPGQHGGLASQTMYSYPPTHPMMVSSHGMYSMYPLQPSMSDSAEEEAAYAEAAESA